jgi:solute carrier family 13 (sodium-dependent dicarboxylate transporter), member 2/3/5
MKSSPAGRRHPTPVKAEQRKRMTIDSGIAAPALAQDQSARRHLALAGQILCVVVPLAIWFMPVDIEPVTKHGLAIAMFMVVAWITQVLDYTVTGFIGCFLFWALGIVKFPVAFSGFANDTAWFLFSALLLGVIATRSGVARRLAYVVMLRIGSTYPRILLGLIVTDFLLTFIVPSGVARLVIMAAIALGLVEAFRAQTGSNVARGMFLVLTYTANIFDKMIIAGAGSITARGLIEKVGGVEVLWSAWFLAFLPCSIITVLAAWRLTLWMYPPEVVSLAGGRDYLLDELKKMGPWSALEKKAALLLGAAVALWLTDFIHHISPAVIGMGVGLFALLPPVGILEAEDLRKLNYMPVFFVAAAVSMGTVLEATKGIEFLTNLVFSSIQPYMTSLLSTTVIMYWAAFVYHFLLASEISMLGTSIPLVMNFAKAEGMSPLLLGMIWTFAAGGKLFAYQSGVLIVGYSYGYFEARDLLRMGWWLTLVEFVILVLLVQFYWPLIGIS